MRLIARATLFITLLAVTGLSQTAPPFNDFQSWNDVQLTVPVLKSKDKKKEKINLVFAGTLRFGSDASRLADKRIGLGIDFKVTPFLTLTPGYLYRASEPYEGKKEMEHRIRAEATLEKKLPNFSLRSRSRFEFRIRGSAPDSVRFRNRFTLSVPVKRAGKEMFAPFVADEPFYDFSKKVWSRNEFSAGISKKFSSTFTLDVFYLMQRNKSGYPRNINAIGTAFKFKLP